ncbi:MAG: Tetratricopeptide repeat protein, partial [Nocardioidaceae bacterium]|nr:Tetratricopeptide repeat protein [Nocardioidaceae bacterium]
RLVILPELGGRIHVGHDKTTGYDFFYRNSVIKPALVGLTGPWLSGGVEFNWPQHHRPATYMPVDTEIEHHADGSATVWCSDHEPFNRMKGMHGITLHPDRAYVELHGRLHNRSEDVQSFLWWANVGARVHDDYQSFFPRDVRVVADHAKRATTTFPRAEGRYYGVDYSARVTPEHPDADRLDWYRNIPVPTSYMCVGSTGDFFGGYDHAARAGFVHVADHRVSPGKKQWTWGNAEFGRAWDRNLTDGDGPYVELMAGVYTDNQPDFSFLAPGETKTFVQRWFPIQQIGPVREATAEAAISLETVAPGRLQLGLGVTGIRRHTNVTLTGPTGDVLWSDTVDLEPGHPFVTTIPMCLDPDQVVVDVESDGQVLARWSAPAPSEGEIVPATEPPAPAEVGSVEELYLTGLHLAQYRHATWSPEPYWLEALRRDPGDSRSATALAARAYRRGEFDESERLLRVAIARLTARNPNPYDGEPYYRLGLALQRQGRHTDAHEAFAKSAWSAAWRSPAGFATAVILASEQRWEEALVCLDETLRRDTDHLGARALRVIALRALSRSDDATTLLTETLRLDPLDWWSRDLAGDVLGCDAQTLVDVALAYAGAGLTDDAVRLLEDAATKARDEAWTGVGPLTHYHRAAVLDRAGRTTEAAAARESARTIDDRYCFPGRLDDALALRAALAADPTDGRAAALLGHWCYDRGRKDEAIELWELAVRQDPSDAVAWRNLGIARHNVRHDSAGAVESFARAAVAAPQDGRLLYEQDQLALRTAAKPEDRLATLTARPDLVRERDDLTIALIDVLTSVDRPEEALTLVSGRSFQPWEGGEGLALGAWERVHLRLARQALHQGELDKALTHATAARDSPETLGEAPHPLANRSDVLLVLGAALAALGRAAEARSCWDLAAEHQGDFRVMSPQTYSEKTYFQVLALRRLGQDDAATRLLDGLDEFATQLSGARAGVDYFATSLPSLLLFDDDLDQRQADTATFLLAQVQAARGDATRCREMLGRVLVRDPNHAGAHDLEWALSHQEDDR